MSTASIQSYQNDETPGHIRRTVPAARFGVRGTILENEHVALHDDGVSVVQFYVTVGGKLHCFELSRSAWDYLHSGRSGEAAIAKALSQ